MVAVKQLLRGAKEYADVVRELRALGEVYISVGIQGEDADDTYPNGATLVEVATANEFGTDTIPQRSFIRSTFDEKRSDLAEFQRAQIAKVADGKITAEVANERIGLWAASQVQAKIGSNIPPPNAQSTIDRKGSSATLIDTGAMRQAITHEVHTGKPPRGDS